MILEILKLHIQVILYFYWMMLIQKTALLNAERALHSPSFVTKTQHHFLARHHERTLRQTPVNEMASLGLSLHLLRSSETRTFLHLRTGLCPAAVRECVCSQTRALRLESTESVHEYVPFTHKHTHKGHTTFQRLHP